MLGGCCAQCFNNTAIMVSGTNNFTIEKRAIIYETVSDGLEISVNNTL